ncbi:hypothetical protein HY503_01150 [Candidatus Woesebacteria bacterium]|nr:hypothetical protein [Candidatus Woesebacteria bacterium]
MSRFKFDFLKIGPHKRPLINIQIAYQGKSINNLALIDSGADFNVFDIEIGKVLGIDLSGSKEVKFTGVGNRRFELIGKMAIVTLMVFKKGDSHSFDAPVIFTDQLPGNGTALLGETGFFDQFEEITFYYKRGKIILET